MNGNRSLGLLVLLWAVVPCARGDVSLTTLIAFNGANGGYPNALTLGNDGNFYGTTSAGGSGLGTVFRMSDDGTLTPLVAFNGNNGAYPSAALTLGEDGSFYGTTSGGGITNSRYSQGMGTVFRMTPSGALTTLVSFNLTNGARPQAALALGNERVSPRIVNGSVLEL
jgi:uncharacterized repeat protein (TIGR03803 family)